MFTGMVEFDDDFRTLAAIPDVIDRQRPRLLGAAGTVIRRDAHANLLVKAHGGRGEDGVTWKPPTPEQARRKQRMGKPLIGVRSGQMLALSNLSIRDVGQEVVIEFADIEKAAIFDADRSLLPSSIPPRWYRHAQSAVQSAVDAVVNRTV